MPRIWNLSFHEYKLFYTDPKYELVLCKKIVILNLSKTEIDSK